MSSYLRPKVSGATVFLTVALARRGGSLLVEEIMALRAAVRQVKSDHPFEIRAWVVLPDHLHAVWSLPPGDRDYGLRWGAIKARFTRTLREKYDASASGGRPGFSPAHPRLPEELPVVTSGRYAGLKPGLRKDKREAAIWQRRFWEHHIRDAADYTAHVRYCLLNPVKHGLVERAVDWPYSSIHRDIRAGRVEPEISGVEFCAGYGEP